MAVLRKKWGIALLGALVAVAVCLVFGPDVTVVNSAEAPGLDDVPCVACHPKEPSTIAARGGKHKTDVGCTDCHTEHPPQGAEAIPACDMCHDGEPHYALENCAGCHSDPHAPLALAMEGDFTAPCLTCHKQQGDEVQAHPSAHTDLACTDCHAVHRQIPDCMECHEKHTEDQDLASCKSCHPVHMPLVVKYAQDTPSHYCAACHQAADDFLMKNTTKHHDLACVYCHKFEHKTVPPCFACHPDQHPESMLKRFPNCGDCHGTAHDLRN